MTVKPQTYFKVCNTMNEKVKDSTKNHSTSQEGKEIIGDMINKNEICIYIYIYLLVIGIQQEYQEGKKNHVE